MVDTIKVLWALVTNLAVIEAGAETPLKRTHGLVKKPSKHKVSAACSARGWGTCVSSM